jgi:tRNA-dihydrouridine synthase A
LYWADEIPSLTQNDKMYHKSLKNKEKIFAVAPMMDWTDRHCRYFHRLMTRRGLLYTEMVVADAILHADLEKLIGGDRTSTPVALQIGGSDPRKLAEAVKLCEAFGFSEINLNVGCPSDRVQSGTFGACLMREPELVGECVAAMKSVTDLPVTVKCRLGVDDQDTGPALDGLARAVWQAGCDGLWVHARKAWLEGLSPKENRDVPPLDYARVERLKSENASHFIGLNGGLGNLNQAMNEMEQGGLDGVMVGRAAYQSPSILRDVDQVFYGETNEPIEYDNLISAMMDYCEAHLAGGGRLHQVTRHMTGLFQGVAGARRWRQILSIEAPKAGAGPGVIEQAYREVARNITEGEAA